MFLLRRWINAVYRFFRRLKFRYKLSFYFMVFGLIIGYCSFVIYTHLATKQMMSIMTTIADEWIRSDRSHGDSILDYINKPYSSSRDENFPSLRFILNELTRNAGIKDIVIYGYDRASGMWFMLYRNKAGYIKIGSMPDADKIRSLEQAMDTRISYSDSILPGRGEAIHFRINLTRPVDRNIYIMEISVDRIGFLTRAGGLRVIVIYTLSIFVISLIIARFIALHISRPISRLSHQAKQIAAGDLEVRTDIISRDEIGDLSFAINTMAGEIGDYLNDINERMDAISVMNRIDKAVLSSKSRDDLVMRVTSFVSELFDECYIALGIADSVEKRYHILSRRGGADLDFSSVGDEILLKNRELYVIDGNIDSDEMDKLNRAAGSRFCHFINLPIYIDDEYIGSFVAGKTDGIAFTQFEVDTLAALADQVGVAMKSVRTLEEKENLYLGIITSLSKAIDAKSRWTAGHSERVASYAMRIAERLALDEQTARELNMAAILHDIGKIGVPEHLLDRPGRFTEHEYMLVREHPYESALIVSEIPGSRMVYEGVLYHHEAWDGSGYPFGLQGEAIPLIARIITVADVYDALVSDRPYRKGMSVSDALLFLKSESGRHFDPELVPLMIDIVKEDSGSGI